MSDGGDTEHISQGILSKITAATSSPEHDQMLNITDKLQVLVNHRYEIATSLNLLDKNAAYDLLCDIDQNSPLVIRHPYDRYFIPVTSPRLEEEIISPIAINYVNRQDEPVFVRNPNYYAFYSPERSAVYMDKDGFSPTRRIESWLCTLRAAGCAYEEAILEREIRHGLFYKATKYFIPEVRKVNEAYARAQLGGWWLKDIAWGMKFEGYKPGEAQAMDRYYRLFRLAQYKGIDDYDVLEYMAKNRWFNEKGDYDLDADKIETKILNYLGESDLNIWAKSASKQSDKLTLWRYSVWRIVRTALKEHHLEPVVDWDLEMAEERYFRENWPVD